MHVERIEDRPRPTKSYTDEQWSAILACGQRVDCALRESDVRLTMGGEPTFVSIDDMEGAEWNTLALGAHVEPFLEIDPYALRPALPAYRVLMQTNPFQETSRTAANYDLRRSDPTLATGRPNDSGKPVFPEHPPARGTSGGHPGRGALCVEPRQGVLHVFMPPIERLEPYLHLIAQVEQTAEQLQLPVRIEGYPPPSDPRMQRIQVTPDPGVLEVNIHPANSWDQLVSNTTVLYEQARQIRLGTDKFMVDGRHTGTGGGNHLVLGGATVQDSPFLRRPDLLRSLIAFFNNHPALSHLFSGQFVGPTSQAPRIDEARQDSLYELEIAFQALDADAGHSPPWIVDRLFRNLLIDVTGNTHRTEFCVDKLYSPDTIHGRQGLLELRGFEMPPDARMSLAQQLLVRALMARFWQRPYRRSLQRWGTAIHDRFGLPYFVWKDIADVVVELGEGDYGLDVEWFRPHWEFRFSRYGSISARGLEVEIRQAIEPWHVLGEEPGAVGTARYVDSSVGRCAPRF